MTTYPEEFSRVIIPFQELFSKPVFKHVKLLLAAAILAPGKRTVSALLRIVGLSREKNFHKYHRVLSLSCWSAHKASVLLLRQLLNCFLPQGPVIVGIDETLERRWGSKIAQRGIYRDSVRSSGSQFVKSSGLRWISLMLLLPLSWSKRVWALPFLTVLAPSERYNQGQGKKHKKITDWARQMLLQLRRWLPNREIIAVGDSSYAVIDLLAALQGKVSFITRLRLDAALYEPVPRRKAGKVGRSRKKGKRLPTLEQLAAQADTRWQTLIFPHWYGHKEKCMQIATGTALWYHSGKPAVSIRWVLLSDPEGKLGTSALLSTDLALTAEQIITYFARRWSMEVTFQEVRAHLGVETQRQWSAKAIARSTPVLFGLFSLITLIADSLQGQGKMQISTAAWYEKKHPTFSDAIACLRQLLWQESSFYMSAQKDDMVKLPREQLLLFQQALAWAV
ncbi:MAG TPA: transposase [Phormidium sp.]